MKDIPLLRVQNLVKHFPVRSFWKKSLRAVRAVDGLSFDLKRGETLSLVGESGCGKTTTGRLVLRLIDPTAGRIYFEEREITDLDRNAMRPLRRQMQVVFQDPYSSLNPRMTVKDIIGESLRRHMHLSTGAVKEQVQSIMAKVGLRPEHYDRHPHEFSGGQRQRIAVARALVLQPKLIVADEPLSALDVSVQAQVINLLCRLKDEFQLSYLFISHDLSVVEYLSDRIAVMYVGQIVEMAARDAICGQPLHPYTLALFSAAPVPRVGGAKRRIILQGDVASPLDPPSGCRFHPRCFQARPLCAEACPEFREIGSDRWVACHFPLE